MTQRNPLVVKIIWVLAQGWFLPLVLWFNDLRTLGNYGWMIGVFILIEALYLVDAYLFLRIFQRSKD